MCARVTHSPAGIHHPSRGGVTYISTRLLTWVREDAPRPNLANDQSQNYTFLKVRALRLSKVPTRPPLRRGALHSRSFGALCVLRSLRALAFCFVTSRMNEWSHFGVEGDAASWYLQRSLLMQLITRVTRFDLKVGPAVA